MIDLPADTRIKPKSKQRIGGYLAPWRNPALTRAQKMAIRQAKRRTRIAGDVIHDVTAHESQHGKVVEGTHGTEGKAGRILRRVQAAFASIAGALATQR